MSIAFCLTDYIKNTETLGLLDHDPCTLLMFCNDSKPFNFLHSPEVSARTVFSY